MLIGAGSGGIRVEFFSPKLEHFRALLAGMVRPKGYFGTPKVAFTVGGSYLTLLM